MKPTKKKKIVKAWAVLGAKGEWWDKVTTEMSENLLKFYKNSPNCKVVSCTITYTL